MCAGFWRNVPVHGFAAELDGAHHRVLSDPRLRCPGRSTFESLGGLGAEIGGDFALTGGVTLDIYVGGQGTFVLNGGVSGGGVGGGGTFVVAAGAPLQSLGEAPEVAIS